MKIPYRMFPIAGLKDCFCNPDHVPASKVRIILFYSYLTFESRGQ